MSNNTVGNIYQHIINEVIEASRVDFEDQGVGEEVLEELRKVCFFLPSVLSCARHTYTYTYTYTHTHTDRQTDTHHQAVVFVFVSASNSSICSS